MKKTKLMLGDNMESLKKIPDNSIDSVVTDPPYGLSFMNKKWDYDVPSVDFWKEVYRVLKPGGHILSFGGTRTYHRMVVNIEDAGFEIRDQIMWLYGSGFPKSHNIGKAVDKIEGNEREGGEIKTRSIDGNSYGSTDTRWDVEPSKGNSPYEGWGTALKPANEPICVARKPLSENTIAENVLKWGTGGINIDGCRIGIVGIDDRSAGRRTCNIFDEIKVSGGIDSPEYIPDENGRFPANLILDEIAGELLDEQSGERKVGKGSRSGGFQKNYIDGEVINRVFNEGYNDKGGASRFFYCAKVSKSERNMGLDGFEDKIIEGRDTGQDERNVAYKKRPTPTKNSHPTLKPVNLMAYLCRLVTPTNGICMDPFMGSGSTGIAAQLEGFRFVGMEMDSEYFEIAEARIDNWEQYKKFIK
jgi:site-specific DNA-methyltransferase (adenine-specific)